MELFMSLTLDSQNKKFSIQEWEFKAFLFHLSVKQVQSKEQEELAELDLENALDSTQKNHTIKNSLKITILKYLDQTWQALSSLSKN